jgi:hypothetical protein
MALRKIMTRRLKTVDHILEYNKINLLKSPTTDDFSTKPELLQFQLWNNFLANFDKALIFCSTFLSRKKWKLSKSRFVRDD